MFDDFRNIKKLQDNLQGAPRKLAFVCVIQAFVLIFGIFLGKGGAECQLVVDENGQLIRINCDVCHTMQGMQFRDVTLLIIGLTVIGIGLFAALKHDMAACRMYGLCMLFYAFILGITAIYTGMRAPVISKAADQVTMDDSCQKIAFMMADNIRYHAALYAFACVLNCGGAVYAIISKQYFDYENIQADHRSATRCQDSL